MSPTCERWAVAAIDGCIAGEGGAWGSCREGTGPLSYPQASRPLLGSASTLGLGFHQ